MASKGVRAAEARAQIDLNRLCETDPVPPTLNLLPILTLIPHKFWTGPPCPSGHLVFGLSPRASCSLTAPVKHLPQLTKLLTSFVRAHLPHLDFCCIVVRLGGKLQAHCDSSVTGPSVVFSGSGLSQCGFWIADSQGRDFEEFEGRFLAGCEVELLTGPLQFDARIPHCGRITGKSQPRVSAAAFLLKRNSEPCLETLSTLRTLGFNIPDPQLLRGSRNTSLKQTNPYLSPRTLYHFFKPVPKPRRELFPNLEPPNLQLRTTVTGSSSTAGKRDQVTDEEDGLILICDDTKPPVLAVDDDDVVMLTDTL